MTTCEEVNYKRNSGSGLDWRAGSRRLRADMGNCLFFGIEYCVKSVDQI